MVGISSRQRELSLVQDSSFKSNFRIFHLVKFLYLMLDKFISLLTISSIFIAINCLLLVYFSFLLYKIRVNFRLLLASFFVTFAVYNLNKLTDIKEDSINLLDRAEFTGKYKHCIIFAVIASFFTALYLSFLQSPIAIFIILFPFCLGFVYSIKISNFRLKDVIGVKSITVALAWTVIGTFLPTAALSYNFTQSSLISSFFF